MTTFEHNGETWNTHQPGDPNPTEGNRPVHILTGTGETNRQMNWKFAWRLPSTHYSGGIIGWRYTDDPEEYYRCKD